MDKTELIRRLDLLLNEVSDCEEAVQLYADDPQVMTAALLAAQNMAGFIVHGRFRSVASAIEADFRTALEADHFSTQAKPVNAMIDELLAMTAYEE